MNDIRQDLEGQHQVQRSKIVNHPAYVSPVLMAQHGWAKRGQETNWHEIKIETIEQALQEKNT